MTEHRTESILQRVPKILAVTAASYGIDLQARSGRPQAASHQRSNRSQRQRELSTERR
jgi:hypothetical protein